VHRFSQVFSDVGQLLQGDSHCVNFFSWSMDGGGKAFDDLPRMWKMIQRNYGNRLSVDIWSDIARHQGFAVHPPWHFISDLLTVECALLSVAFYGSRRSVESGRCYVFSESSIMFVRHTGAPLSSDMTYPNDSVPIAILLIRSRLCVREDVVERNRVP